MLLRHCQIGYYLPFYFQAVEGVSATQSGVRFIALAFPEVLAIVIMGAIVTKTGLYVRDSHPVLKLDGLKN